MNTAFYNGISGAKAGQGGIDVWANNIANINTFGFKGNEVEFASLFSKKLAQTGEDNPVNSSLGLGTRVGATPINLKQGTFVNSDNPFDLAIQGGGWFGVNNKDNTYYTRSGNFSVDAGGNLVDSKGGYVLGKSANNILDGAITHNVNRLDIGAVEAQDKVNLPINLYYPPTPTTMISLKGNLGIAETHAKFSANIFTKEAMKLFELEFSKAHEFNVEDREWDVSIKVFDEDRKELEEEVEGSITFGNLGSIVKNDIDSIKVGDSDIKIDFGEGFVGLISNRLKNESHSIQNDGSKSGDIKNFVTNRNGEIVAIFDNGKNTIVGKVALFHFANDQGLSKVDSNYFAKTSNSGDPIFLIDRNGNPTYGSTIHNYKLETSNTDMSSALTKLLILQKSFDANSKSISTGDELIRNALQMKR